MKYEQIFPAMKEIDPTFRVYTEMVLAAVAYQDAFARYHAEANKDIADVRSLRTLAANAEISFAVFTSKVQAANTLLVNHKPNLEAIETHDEGALNDLAAKLAQTHTKHRTAA